MFRDREEVAASQVVIAQPVSARQPGGRDGQPPSTRGAVPLQDAARVPEVARDGCTSPERRSREASDAVGLIDAPYRTSRAEQRSGVRDVLLLAHSYSASISAAYLCSMARR